MLDTNCKQNLQMQTRWNIYWRYAMYKDMLLNNVLDELSHNTDVDLQKEEKTYVWLYNNMYRPDGKDVFSRNLAPTYGSWNIKNIVTLISFYGVIKELVQQRPALEHALHIGKYFCAYDHTIGKRCGKPILCTIFKNKQLSHYELYPSIVNTLKFRANSICVSSSSSISKKCKNDKPTYFLSRGGFGIIYFKEESKPVNIATN